MVFLLLLVNSVYIRLIPGTIGDADLPVSRPLDWQGPGDERVLSVPPPPPPPPPPGPQESTDQIVTVSN